MFMPNGVSVYSKIFLYIGPDGAAGEFARYAAIFVQARNVSPAKVLKHIETALAR
jgi:hypothetical protein